MVWTCESQTKLERDEWLKTILKHSIMPETKNNGTWWLTTVQGTQQRWDLY